jgi:hypothetical protein
MANSNYTEQAHALGKAADIAIEAFEKFPPKGFNSAQLDHVINTYKEFKNNALHPEAKYKNLKSLSYVKTDILTIFQEGSGDFVNYFWKQVADQRLGFKRENKLQKILKRGKIKSQIEYDFIIDVLVPYQQEGVINETDANILKQMIGEFERK